MFHLACWQSLSDVKKCYYKSDVDEINGLTADWVSAHVYWTDVHRKTVEVADYDGKSRRVLVSDDLKTPRSIVAAPLFG